MDMEQKFEFDAPVYFNFDDVLSGVEVVGDDTDQWFMRHSHLEKDDFGLSAGPEKQQEAPTPQLPAVKTEPDEAAPPVEDDVAQPALTATVKTTEVDLEEEEEEEDEMEPPPKLGQKRDAAIASLRTPLISIKRQRVQRKRTSSKEAAAAIRAMLKPSHHRSHTVQTPECIRRHLEKQQGQVKKTREELDAEQMDKMQAESRKRLHEHRKSFHRLATASGKKPAKMAKYSKPTTEAVGFKFRTDRRCRQRRSASVSSRPPPPPSHVSSFPMSLRSASNSLQTESEGPRKVTEAKPFNFRLDSRFPSKHPATEGGEKKNLVPTAEFVFKFQAKTPERFRGLTRKNLHSASACVEEASHTTASSSNSSRAGLTIPCTPKLLTKCRTRPVLAKSSEELEEEQLAHMKQNPLKALPVNLKVFTKNGLMGLPKKPHHPPTQPLTPKLTTRERGEARAHDNAGTECDSRPSFKAQPLPKGLFDKVMGLPKKPDVPLTCPKSPAFALKRRELHTNANEEKEEDQSCHIIVARPVPDFSRKFEPQLYHKKTELEPFAFEDRYKARPTRATLVEQILAKQKKGPFKANPVPNFDTPSLPRSALPCTASKTPTLHTRIRGQEYETKWKQTLSEMAQKEKENAEFRAKDASVLYKPPFKARPANRPITEVSNVILHTDVRSEQRSEFDQQCRSKEEQREQENQERLRVTEVEEAKIVTRLRQGMVHKAQPIRNYARTLVQPSNKPLTAPQSPHFHLQLRSMH